MENDEARSKYFKRRSKEAIGVLVECEVKVAVARMLAIDPDAKEGDFLEIARQAWREVVGDVACRSVVDFPRSVVEETT